MALQNAVQAEEPGETFVVAVAAFGNSVVAPAFGSSVVVPAFGNSAAAVVSECFVAVLVSERFVVVQVFGNFVVALRYVAVQSVAEVCWHSIHNVALADLQVFHFSLEKLKLVQTFELHF